VKHQLSKSAEPPRGGEPQKAWLFEGRRRVPSPPGQQWCETPAVEIGGAAAWRGASKSLAF